MNYSLELEINAPRERVVELFDSLENLGAWQPGYLGAEQLEGEPGAVGSKMSLKYAHGKREIELVETIVTNNFPEEFSALFEAKGMEMTVRNYFTEAGEGKTTWRSENEAKVSGIVMRLISFIMPGCFKKQSLDFMVNFKAFVEEGKDLRKE